jgi:4-hydroxyphenylpyruvate dioxygenase
MRRSIATVCVSGTLRGKLEAIAAARFDGVEIFENDLIYYNGTPAELRAMAADLGLGIDLYQPFRDFEGVAPALFKRNLDRAERKFDVMQALGAPMMLACSNVGAPPEGDDELAAEQLYELAERAAKRNLLIGYEALAWGRKVNHYEHAWKIVKRVNHPHLGIILDSFHMLSLGDNPEGIGAIPGEKIFFVQVADAPRMAMDVLQWSRHYRCFPGQGQFDLANFMVHTLAAGYTGPVSLEVFNDLFREAPNRRTSIDAMQSLLYLEAKTRERLEGERPGNDASAGVAKAVLNRVELFDPPAAPAVEGFAFIEFAVRDDAESSLAALLEAMGFRRAGRHRSKNVTLYRQGEVNLVINAEAGSFADAQYAIHGPTVCAMSLVADDSVRALNRATSFHCQRFDSRVGAQEAKIPAIYAPDGNLVYFVPADLGLSRLFEADFELTPQGNAPDPGSGVALIDHIALALPVDQLDTWILFCRAVLGMEPGESLELSDPHGLVRSCGVANANRKVRLVLNVSQSRATTTARAISAHGGASVHHIAFSSTDIFASVEKMRRAGVGFVPISPNYYDDLGARVELEVGMLDRLRKSGILYDRSPAGEYLHVYTQTFADRFFFEIIQRTGAYDAYGALNSPARMASQAQESSRR